MDPVIVSHPVARAFGVSPALVAELAAASNERIQSPLWNFPPADRPAVLHERATRFGKPSDQDFDPLYH